MKNIIEIEELSFSYPEKQIFNNLNLCIKKGSFTTVLGPNSAGKTTLIKLITGQINANTFIMIDGEPIIKESFNLIENHIALVTNSFNNHSKITVLEALEQINKKNQKKVKQLKLEDKLKNKLTDLTEEEQVIVEFAKGILKEPKIFVIDSALESLTPKNKEIIIKALKQLNQNGTTIINATNNIEDSLIGDYIVILTASDPIFGPVEAIIDNDEIFEYYGLSAPFIVELSQKLKFYNLINKNYTSAEKLVEDLWK